MRLLPFAALLIACQEGDPDLLPVDTGGPPVCGQLEGTSNVLIWQDDGATVRWPEEGPSPDAVATGIAGPVQGEYTYLAVEDGEVILSEDGGCSWDRRGDLPASGDWKLLVAGDRVYAFDLRSGDGARTDDLAASWTTFSLGDAPLGLPTVDARDPARLRAVTSAGVLTSSDGGDTWADTGSLPEGAGAVTVAAAGASDPDVVLVGTETGAWVSRNGGSSWEQRSTTGAALSVAVHPDDADVLFAQLPDDTGVLAIWRSADAGAEWSRLVDAEQIDMAEGQPIWPFPGATSKAISTNGPVPNGSGEPSLALYVMEAGVGTDTYRVTEYLRLHQLAIGEERWVGAIDSIE